MAVADDPTDLYNCLLAIILICNFASFVVRYCLLPDFKCDPCCPTSASVVAEVSVRLIVAQCRHYVPTVP